MPGKRNIFVMTTALALGLGAPQTFAQLSISAPATLNTNAATDMGVDRDPEIATDGAGNWVAVWDSGENLGGTIGTDRDILVSRSTDNGVTWTAPAALNTNAATDTGRDESAQVTTNGAGNWVAVWNSTEDLGGTIGIDNDILVSRSTDNGATWTAPAALNINAAADAGDDFSPQVATDGAGNWVAVWSVRGDQTGVIGTDEDILVSQSTDNGLTWTLPVALNTNANTDTGGDTVPEIATDGAGNWVAVWESTEDLGGTIGDDRDILVSRSTDNGATWTAPATLNTNAASDTGRDSDPQVTTDTAGNWVAVWISNENLGGTIGAERDILVSRSTDNGLTWTAPAPLNTNAASDSAGDIEVTITTDGMGNWIVAWTSIENLGGTIGPDRDVFVSQSTNNGLTWTPPSTLNTNAASDTGDDKRPGVATDGAGNWVAVWFSFDDQGGTIGTDSDILVAPFVLLDDNGNGTGTGEPPIAPAACGACGTGAPLAMLFSLITLTAVTRFRKR